VEREFGIRLAILPVTSPKWIDRFLESPLWNPIALGNGSVVFAHASISLIGKSPALLANAEDLESTSSYFRQATLRTLGKILSASRAGRGFRPWQWTRQIAFPALHEMAARTPLEKKRL